MTELTALDYVEKALRLAVKRYKSIKSNPAAGALEPMYNSIVAQLEYLRDVVNGTQKEKSKLRDLTFGIYAVKEFETSDEIFFERLTDAFYIAAKIRKGLKIQLPHQVNKNFFLKNKRNFPAYIHMIFLCRFP